MNIKKFISCGIAGLSVNACILASMSGAMMNTNAAIKSSADWDYTVSGDYAIISGYKGTSKTVNVPATINGYTVKEIADDFLNDNDNVQVVNLEKGIEKIGNNFCLDADNLSTIRIKNGVKSIGNSFCESTEKLVRVYLPYTLESIGDFGFYGCDLDTNTADTLSLNKIYIYCTDDCARLSSTQEAACFKINSIGYATLWQTDWEDQEGNLILGQYLYRMNVLNSESGFNSSTGALNLSNVNGRCIQYIGDGAICDKSQIKSVNLNAVHKIGAEAFMNCTNLASINNAYTVDTIGNNAFNNTKWYKNKLNSSTKLIKVGQVLYKYNSTSTSCDLSTDSTIMYISENAFNGAALNTIDFGNVNQLTAVEYDFSKLTNIKKYGTKVTENGSFLYDNIGVLAGTPYVKSLVDAKVKKIIADCGLTYGASASSTTTTYKLNAIKKLRQYAVNNWTYEEMDGDQFVEGSILYNSGVCASFALAYAYLLEKCGVNSQVVHGQGHAWNMVEYSKSFWAHVDITTAVQSHDTTSNPLTSGRFLMTDKQRYIDDGDTSIYWEYSDTPNMRIYGIVDTANHKTPICPFGDVNGTGTITAPDITVLQEYLLNKRTLTTAQKLRSDLNIDGKVDAFDLAILKKYLNK